MPRPDVVLIVDDEFGLGEMLREVLTEIGYDVAVTINGRLAWRLLQERQVDLVLTDMMMPVMDGPELARAIRKEPSLRRLPIVLMTALPSGASTEAGLYDAILRKPFTPDTLLTTLRSLLDEKDGSAEPGNRQHE